MEKVILAFETSCDETACALYSKQRGLLGERVYSQWRRHRPYGGVVPELASRDHLRRALPLVDDLLKTTNVRPTKIAYTRGPGLASALLAGATVASGLAFTWGLPLVGVNHLAGHLLSPLLSNPHFAFPYLALLVSGGHTQLWQVKSPDSLLLLGETLDDAAGEAFDKTAVLLDLGYPGGGALEKLAATGNTERFSLPSPAQPNCQFSFSGLKTAVRRLAAKQDCDDDAVRADIAASFQATVARGLARQVSQAIEKLGAERLAIVGGVAQNKYVQNTLQAVCAAKNTELCSPLPMHCGDNAAMIALAAAFQSISSDHEYRFGVEPGFAV
ncbi:tRNA (adenosine(37)-N6)-threonylcarbamoyltransferase complex transferase subunit TsaD [Candidatus Persebacteraceae bacterium Df01]|jgi:N6-L-threonylcarbamoyladenine synthase|uniref:tRNA N6-adenosine threonylcarbamoyltransferase n=1 Tax=Candidatus Doriopsillibacter californiensis TaxID=2970740 RepID=A0ABT7QLY9_9GAMM|nr:tRNA (adenosine(37)-N6)-threonylcarbamoyltransferase complex transferase subunit TsaD [Candidatus Persebacteraceae bacterium Df01]